jgi:hypothetical protein
MMRKQSKTTPEEANKTPFFTRRTRRVSQDALFSQTPLGHKKPGKQEKRNVHIFG